MTVVTRRRRRADLCAIGWQWVYTLTLNSDLGVQNLFMGSLKIQFLVEQLSPIFSLLPLGILPMPRWCFTHCGPDGQLSSRMGHTSHRTYCHQFLRQKNHMLVNLDFIITCGQFVCVSNYCSTNIAFSTIDNRTHHLVVSPLRNWSQAGIGTTALASSKYRNRPYADKKDRWCP